MSVGVVGELGWRSYRERERVSLECAHCKLKSLTIVREQV